MGKLDPNTLIGILNGKVHDLTFSRMKDGTVYVRRTPVRQAEFTAGELLNHHLFKRAVAYVTRVRQAPEKYKDYQVAAERKKKRACDLANSDYRHPPSLQDVDLSSYTGKPGEIIWIQAIDDFRVEGAVVTIAGTSSPIIQALLKSRKAIRMLMGNP